jgi:outer membrane receptor protein involved in Fe transport
MINREIRAAIRPRRERLVAKALTTGVLLGLVSFASAAQSLSERLSAPTRFDIPAQPLSLSLKQLADQAGIQILFEERIVRGMAAPAVRTQETAVQALHALLRGTGLEYTAKGETIAVREKSTTAEVDRSGSAPATGRRPEGAAQHLQIAQAEAAAALPAPAPASQAAAEGATQRLPLEEIIVTANKRAERLIDVPASVTAVSGDTLTSIGATRLEDYVAKVPGLVLSNVSFANGSNQLTIRGITTGFGGNPTVGIYIDDSPFGASTGFGAAQIPDLDPSDLARVEVLRGPQGTLYGAGAMGGLLKYVTTSPDTNAFFGRVQVDGSQVDGGGSGYGVRGTANIPLTETLALRVGGYDREDPGFIDDADRPVHDINSVHVYGGRAAMAWKISDSWNAKLSTLLQRQTTDGSAIVDHDSITFRPVDGDLQQVRAPRTGETSGKLASHDLQLEGDLGWANIATSSSYNEQDVGINLDVTAALGPLIEANFGVPNGGASILTDGKLEKFTQEIRLSSPDSAGAWSWLVGAFYTHEDQDLHQSIVTFDASTGGPLASPLPSFLDAFVFSTFEELAGFGNLTYRFNDLVDVTFGLRYSHNEQSQLETLQGLLSGSQRIAAESSDSSLTYLVTPRFHLSDATMFYVRVASGYRPGGPNLAVAGAPPSYEPDEVVNYEAGLKTELLDRQLSLDIAAFYIDWKDIQLHQTNEQGLDYFGNAGAATSKGVEAAATWRATQGLRLSANVNYTIAELAADLPPGTEVASDGDDLPTTPRWNGQFSADYDFPLWGDWNGFAGTSYRYVGNSSGYFSSPGLPRYQLPSYDVVDLRAGVKSDRWMLTLYAKNIGDTRGQVASYLLGGVNRVSIIQPRTFGVSLSSSF